jgi:hypothetical protein
MLSMRSVPLSIIGSRTIGRCAYSSPMINHPHPFVQVASASTKPAVGSNSRTHENDAAPPREEYIGLHCGKQPTDKQSCAPFGG